MGIFSFLSGSGRDGRNARGRAAQGGHTDSSFGQGLHIDLGHARKQTAQKAARLEPDSPRSALDPEHQAHAAPGQPDDPDGANRPNGPTGPNEPGTAADDTDDTDDRDDMNDMNDMDGRAPGGDGAIPLQEADLAPTPGAGLDPGLDPGLARGTRSRLVHPLRMKMVDGVCHLSEELRGNLLVDDHLARMAREQGRFSVPVVWHRPSAWEKLFGDGERGGRREAKDAAKPGSASAKGQEQDLSAATWVDAYVHRLFEKAMARKVSDIHITYMGPWTQVSFRRMGLVMEEESLDGPTGLQLVRGIFQGQLSQAESGFSEYERYDGRIADRTFLPRGLFAVRLHTEPIQSPHLQGPGITLAMRLLFDAASANGTLAERLACLGFEQKQIELVESFSETTGMTVVSGPTGHGKTTVLKNILEALAENVPTRNYYSLEDPPEYTILGVRQLNVFTKAVSDEERERALLEALAGLMRSDPDVILLGEIRYLGAARAAVNAALTGHSVWTTVHASSGLNVLARFREMGMPVDSALSVLAGVTYQRLLPTLCPGCREPLLPNLDGLAPKLRERLKALYPDSLDRLFVRGKGCSACDHLGLSGQKVACEVIPMRDRRLRELLSQGRVDEAQTHWVHELGGMTHVAHARARVANGEVDPRLAEERLGVPLDSDLQDEAWLMRKSGGQGANARGASA